MGDLTVQQKRKPKRFIAAALGRREAAMECTIRAGADKLGELTGLYWKDWTQTARLCTYNAPWSMVTVVRTSDTPKITVAAGA